MRYWAPYNMVDAYSKSKPKRGNVLVYISMHKNRLKKEKAETFCIMLPRDYGFLKRESPTISKRKAQKPRFFVAHCIQIMHRVSHNSILWILGAGLPFLGAPSKIVKVTSKCCMRRSAKGKQHSSAITGNDVVPQSGPLGPIATNTD